MAAENRVSNAREEPRVPSGYQIEQAVAAWQRLRAAMGSAELSDDEEVIAAALADDVQDPRVLLSRLVDAIIWAERREKEAAEMAATLTERKRRYKDRADWLRDTADQIMQAIEIERATGRYGRLDVVTKAPGTRIIDEASIPAEYWDQPPRVLRKAALLDDLKQGVVVDGAMLSNPGKTLRLTKFV